MKKASTASNINHKRYAAVGFQVTKAAPGGVL
jgi:hypothetical protein